MSQQQAFGDSAPAPIPQSMELILTIDASNQASVDFTSVITSDYSTYKIIGSGIQLTDAGGQGLLMRCSTDNGATFDSGTSYAFNELWLGSDSNQDWNRQAAATSLLVMFPGPTNAVASNSGAFDMDLFNMNSSTLNATFLAEASSNKIVPEDPPDPAVYTNYNIRFSGLYNVLGTVNAIRFLANSGNIIAGKFSLYGIRQ